MSHAEYLEPDATPVGTPRNPINPVSGGPSQTNVALKGKDTTADDYTYLATRSDAGSEANHLYEYIPDPGPALPSGPYVNIP